MIDRTNGHPSKESTPPRQAVILAGGRGTRLRPLTDTLPKPMVPFHGRPFLEYLIEMLRDNGLDRILLLLGYLPDAIRDHFGDGRKWGVRIDYQVSEVEDETGRRLFLAKEKLDEVFLLLYCDNFWPMPMPALWESFSSSDALAQVTVFSNDWGSKKDNMRVGSDGRVEVYDKTRTQPGLKGVDIGFVLVKRPVIELLGQGNPSFEKVVYPRLAQHRQLKAFVTKHPYYSVGSLEQLPRTERFLAREPAIFLDRDGVLNEKMPRGEYVRSWSDWKWRPGALESLTRLTKAGFRVIVVTNQAGVARGVVSEDDLRGIHGRMRDEAHRSGGEIHAVYHCPHHWDEHCECRKPNPGMLFQAQRDYELDLTRTCLIGDDDRDCLAAVRAGCPFIQARSDEPLTGPVSRAIDSREGTIA